jgi:pimeloyl-ACP methyl ester carboxylesterase
MPIARANGLDICYDTIGSPTDPPLLLVMGLGAQMISWRDEFCQQLAAHGLFVVRFDNRDVGLSTHLDGAEVDPLAVMMAALADEPLPPVPYTLSDMADDAFGLLDHLGLQSAHIMGASLGGMIAQTMAAEHPERVLSLVSIMSTTGEPDYFETSPEAQTALLAPPATSSESAVQRALDLWPITSSKRYFDAKEAAARAAREFERMSYPEGAGRQMAAGFASRDHRVPALRTLTIPTLVIHGRDDTLIMPKGGERTAEIIPGATLLMIADMGHDFPEPQWPLVHGAIARHIFAAEPAAIAGSAKWSG